MYEFLLIERKRRFITIKAYNIASMYIYRYKQHVLMGPSWLLMDSGIWRFDLGWIERPFYFIYHINAIINYSPSVQSMDLEIFGTKCQGKWTQIVRYEDLSLPNALV